MAIEAINPATGERIQTYEEISRETANQLLTRAQQSFSEWRRTPWAERAARMKAAAPILRTRQEEYGRLMALEMGKPVAQGRGEVEKCAWVCEFYAEHAERFLAPEMVATDARQSFVAFEPLGLVLAIMPWNFPFWQVFRAAVPALLAGNAVVLKHASNVPGCARELENIFRRAGLPEGLFTNLPLSSSRIGELIEHPLIRGVTLTGSTSAGKSVAATAGAALKKTVLELGGSDPYVILEDADLEQAAKICATARLVNSGQSCIAAKRFIVVEPVRQRFEELMVETMRSRRAGDPLLEETQIGPLARRDLRNVLHDQVQRSVAQGARLLTGGQVPAGPGAFYPPTVLRGVTPGMAAFDEETFGPVAAIISAADEAEAISLANQTAFGLGAAVFTADRERGQRIAVEQFEAGCCFVNDYVHSDPRLPFGGVKESGYGRELSVFGLREFVNVKTVYVK